MLHLLELLGHGNQCHQAPGADFVQMLMAEELCSYGVRRVLVTFTHYAPQQLLWFLNTSFLNAQCKLEEVIIHHSAKVQTFEICW